MFITERFISVIAPHSCIACGRERALLCDWCRPDYIDSLPPRCYSCHRLTDDSAVCSRCRRKSPLTHLWIATPYIDKPKKLLEKLKFERCKSAAKEIAQFIDESLPYLEEKTLVTHVPTATSRRRQRGYDQAEQIALHLAGLRQLPHKTLLIRDGHTRQVGANKKQRLEQMSHAFRAPREEPVKGRTVLLIDDLTTTGATIESAAKELKKAGAKQIFAAAFAQKI